MAKLSVVIPCHNEEPVLPLLLDKLSETAATWQLPVEVLCVDDGSSDGTWSLIEARASRSPGVRGVRLSRNFGQQAAIAAGLWFASGEAVVVMDADLQDPPEVVADLLAAWHGGAQVVHAVRRERRDRWSKRLFASAFYRLLGAVAPFRIPPDAGDFVLLDRLVVDVMNALPEHNRYLRGLRAWVGFRQSEVVYTRKGRAGGRPQYTFRKSLTLAIDGLVSFTTAPLRLATYFGLVSVSVGVVTGAWNMMTSSPVDTTTIVVLLVGGAQLVCLGIAGEYIGRIAQQVKGRPLWIASQTAGLSGAGASALYPSRPARPTSFGRDVPSSEQD